jgi:hypothetical protein
MQRFVPRMDRDEINTHVESRVEVRVAQSMNGLCSDRHQLRHPRMVTMQKLSKTQTAAEL